MYSLIITAIGMIAILVSLSMYKEKKNAPQNGWGDHLVNFLFIAAFAVVVYHFYDQLVVEVNQMLGQAAAASPRIWEDKFPPGENWRIAIKIFFKR